MVRSDGRSSHHLEVLVIEEVYKAMLVRECPESRIPGEDESKTKTQLTALMSVPCSIRARWDFDV